jgi:hypothetical protein
MELLTVQEAAARAGVTTKAIYYSLGIGKLTAYSQFGRVLVNVEELSRYKPRRKQLGKSQIKISIAHPSARGRFAHLLSPVDEFIANKELEKSLDR